MPIANPVGGIADAVGPEQWFRSLPIITQYWFGATIVITLAANFAIIEPKQLVYSWAAVTQKLEVWRLFTPFCFAGMFDFSTLIAVYMLVSFSKQYETGGPFNTGAGGGTADYAFMMLFGVLMMFVTFPLARMVLPLSPLFTRNMIYYVLYVWSKRHPTAQANIWGVPMQAIYLPFAYMALTIFMGNPYADMLHGLAVGHLYYFLVDVIPKVQGRDIMHTPQFLIDQFGVGEYQPVEAPRQPPQQGGGGARAPAGLFQQGGGQQQAPRQGGGGGGGHQWGGGGHALGRE